MRRTDWNSVIEGRGNPVAFDVRSTPLARLADEALVLRAVAHEFDGPNALLSVFRDDPKDALPVNRDDYRVWRQLRAYPGLPRLVAGSTEYNANLEAFLDRYVILVKLPPRPGHHLATLPSSISALLPSS